MLGVLPFVEDPDLSGSAGPTVPQLLPPCAEMLFAGTHASSSVEAFGGEGKGRKGEVGEGEWAKGQEKEPPPLPREGSLGGAQHNFIVSIFYIKF